MIPALVIAAAAVAALVYVTLPLRRERPATAPEEAPEAAEAAARKNTALMALLDLEDERDTGKLAGRDYEVMRARYENEAVSAMREADAVHGPGPGDDELEAEIDRIKQALRCPSCGAPRRPGEPCTRCGA